MIKYNQKETRAQKMIKELKKEGWTIETIAYLLGITIEEVKEELENAAALV